jgi:2-methylaconitate cis-trans-isomerase PrpF
MDFCARVLSLNMVHKSINVTVSVATTAAALVPGTLVHEVSNAAAASGSLRIGHPSGVVHTAGAATDTNGAWSIDWVRLGRTARRIMQGEVLVQPSKLRWLSGLRQAR